MPEVNLWIWRGLLWTDGQSVNIVWRLANAFTLRPETMGLETVLLTAYCP